MPLYVSAYAGEGGEGELTETWDLACDLAAEWAVDAMGICPVTGSEGGSGMVGTGRFPRRGRSARRRLRDGCSPEARKKSKRSAGKSRWIPTGSGGREKRTPDLWQAVGNLPFFLWPGSRAKKRRRPGTRKGDRTAEAVLQDTGRGDYRKFLERLFVCREEMQVDPDSIDYIPYLYGLEYYGNVLLMEPLETTETSRLEEFVIAIDTSGSCSGAVVRRFLEETYGILSRRENFFRKMNVHLIQCDSMIQDHRKTLDRVLREWKDYMAHLKIQGLGERILRRCSVWWIRCWRRKRSEAEGAALFHGRGRHLSQQKTGYETAFVFPWKRPEKQQAPGWAWKLYLPEGQGAVSMAAGRCESRWRDEQDRLVLRGIADEMTRPPGVAECSRRKEQGCLVLGTAAGKMRMAME